MNQTYQNKTPQVEEEKINETLGDVFSWTKHDGQWLPAGQAGYEAKTVAVVTKAGKRSEVTLGRNIGITRDGREIYQIACSLFPATEEPFRWAKYEGEWLPAGRIGMEGKTVTVTTRAGIVKTVTLGAVAGKTGYGAIVYYKAEEEEENHYWTWQEASDMIADMDLEYKYSSNADIARAQEILNAGGNI